MAAIDASESDKDTVSAAALVGAMKSCEGVRLTRKPSLRVTLWRKMRGVRLTREPSIWLL